MDLVTIGPPVYIGCRSQCELFLTQNRGFDGRACKSGSRREALSHIDQFFAPHVQIPGGFDDFLLAQSRQAEGLSRTRTAWHCGNYQIGRRAPNKMIQQKMDPGGVPPLAVGSVWRLVRGSEHSDVNSSVPLDPSSESISPPHGLDLIADGMAPGEVAALRSLGWELERWRSGTRLLAARLRNGTLSGPLKDFLSSVPVIEMPDTDDSVTLHLTLRQTGSGMRLLVPWAALGERAVSARHIALLRLPALRGFWERVLRRGHFQRLLRVLPHAWFLETDAPPPGAIIPGLGLVSKSRLPSDARFELLDEEPSSAPPSVLIENLPGDVAARRLVATYERKSGRVTLVSVSLAT